MFPYFPRSSNHIPILGNATSTRNRQGRSVPCRCPRHKWHQPGIASIPAQQWASRKWSALLTIQFHYDEANKYPHTESLPLPATTAANSSRNEAIPMSKYGRRIRCQDTSMGRCSANKIGCVVLFLTVAIIIAVGVFARS